jgi:RNA polymerase sigma-70 factor (ECF subfamily)
MDVLIERYLEALPRGVAEAVDRSRLEGELRAICAEVTAAMPGLADNLAEFVRSLATRLQQGQQLPVEHGVELAIAFGAGIGDADAVARLDALLRASVRRAAAPIDPSPAFADTVAQELRTRLLVGEHARIRDYAGRGALSAWLHIAARRIALNRRRDHKDTVRGDLSSKLEAVVDAPDVTYLRARYRGEFEEALRVALGRLPSRERMALCLNVRDGMSGNQLASVYGVSRATANRLLARARELLQDEIRRELRTRLGVSDSEFESLARALYSEVDVSIVRLLQDGAEDLTSKKA